MTLIQTYRDYYRHNRDPVTECYSIQWLSEGYNMPWATGWCFTEEANDIWKKYGEYLCQ